MPGIDSNFIPILKDLYAFRALPDSALHKIAQDSELVDLPKDQQLSIPDGEDAPLYMVISGRVILDEMRPKGEIRSDDHQLKMGQFFGADTLLYARNRRWMATALIDTQMLEISAPVLRRLMMTTPQLKDGLLLASQMQQWLRDKAFRWIGDDELVYLISRKHSLFLVLSLILPVLGMLGAFLLFGISAALVLSSFKVVALWFGIAVLVLSSAWAVWRYIDWGNDYYIVTDQRVVWVEQVLGLYESRREAFLNSIRNKQVRTANWFERRFGYGDIIMTVYAGQVVFKNIPDPAGVTHMIDILIRRAEMRIQKLNVQETQKIILDKIENVEKIIRQEVDPLPPPAPPKVPPQKPLLPSLKDILAYFHLETRFEQGELITYRTHIVFLLIKLFIPALTQLVVLAGTIFMIRGDLNDLPMIPTLPTTILLAITLTVFCGIWALYHFSDWRNDIYQIAPDKVLDKDHKPFQEEHVVQSFINDIQSMEIERENIFEMLFNFGTIIINSGTDQKLTFDNIPNPAHALQDIYSYQHKLKRAQEISDMHKQTEQSAMLLATYHLYEEQRRNKSGASGLSQDSK